ncbi:MAG TPA: hypothetical protein VHD35_06430 [Chitinophagaceae bacterium]|nr:hypothetical protein [Chitinophagaceae bacterium]
MDNSFWQYISRLELLAFFSGYPLVYAIIMVFFGNKNKGKKFPIKISSYLPYAYALSGTLYFGLILRNLYPDYSIKNIGGFFDHSYLKIWAMLSLFFWIPLLAKKPVISLLHSLLFFIYLIKDAFLYNSSLSGRDMIKNETKIYTISILLNIITLTAIVLLYFLIIILRKNKSASQR